MSEKESMSRLNDMALSVVILECVRSGNDPKQRLAEEILADRKKIANSNLDE